MYDKIHYNIKNKKKIKKKRNKTNKQKLPPTALRAFGPVLTLSNAAHSSPCRPHMLVACVGVWGTFCWELLLGT